MVSAVVRYYSFGESTWDLVFFIGTGALGPGGSFQTCLLAVVNVLMQVESGRTRVEKESESSEILALRVLVPLSTSSLRPLLLEMASTLLAMAPTLLAMGFRFNFQLPEVVFVAIAYFNFTTAEVNDQSVVDATRWRRCGESSRSMEVNGDFV